jgi:hypothetical protein
VFVVSRATVPGAKNEAPSQQFLTEGVVLSVNQEKVRQRASFVQWDIHCSTSLLVLGEVVKGSM